MKKNMILLMTVLLVLCWYTTVGTWMSSEDNYQAAMANAESFEQRELYLDAIAEYETAMQYRKDTSEAMLRIANDYRNLGDMDSWLGQMKSIVAQYGPREELVGEIYSYYTAEDDTEEAISYISDLKAAWPEDPVVDRYYQEIRKDYYALYHSFQAVGPFLGNYAVYEYEGKKGIIDSAGEVVLKAAYDEIGIPLRLSDGFPVRVGNETYVISEKGYKTAQPEADYEALGILSGNRILAKKDGKYGYLNADLEAAGDFVWDDATNFANDLAAVKQGNKWALIDSKGELLTEYIYTDVKRDPHNFCSRSGLLWVNEGKGYYLLDEKLEPLGDALYEDVRCFYEEGAAAVCQNGKWGFADRQGQLVVPFTFDDADSFRIGYAPVKQGGLWGYAAEDGSVLIEYAFDEALGFNGNGTAPVKRQGSWELIKLGIYE